MRLRQTSGSIANDPKSKSQSLGDVQKVTKFGTLFIDQDRAKTGTFNGNGASPQLPVNVIMWTSGVGPLMRGTLSRTGSNC
ncbi:unnamed protein product [Protopolystoma xenopodis]|uniref:Uncharacterized protein n=1 Tax=Protopolystoma xenopodis TaxID=117903 RepID=A0A3S5BMP5_9PLAT|nr:unnamed protein product [Protopolystoma xenopodis]